MRADVAEQGDLDALAETLRRTFGHVDVWVNNAGADILTGDAARLSRTEKLDRLLAVDLRGTVLASWKAVEVMDAHPPASGGVILNMSWDHVLGGGIKSDYAQVFCAAKGGVYSFSRALAHSVAPRIRVNEGPAEGVHASLRRAEHLGVVTLDSASEHMVPGHVEDDAARGGWVGVHHLDGLPRGEHRATQVHGQQSIELLGAGQAGGIAGEDVRPRIVHPYVHMPEGAAQRFRERVQIALLGDVRAHRLRAPAGGGGAVGGLVSAAAVRPVRDRHVRPRRRVREGDRTPKAARCARDDGHLAVQRQDSRGVDRTP